MNNLTVAEKKGTSTRKMQCRRDTWKMQYTQDKNKVTPEKEKETMVYSTAILTQSCPAGVPYPLSLREDST